MHDLYSPPPPEVCSQKLSSDYGTQPQVLIVRISHSQVNPLASIGESIEPLDVLQAILPNTASPSPSQSATPVVQGGTQSAHLFAYFPFPQHTTTKPNQSTSQLINLLNSDCPLTGPTSHSPFRDILHIHEESTSESPRYVVSFVR